MSWFSKIFPSEKSVDKLVDASISGVDKLFYTDEEKADAKQKVLAWYLDLLAALKPFNVAMRILAIGVFSMWALHIIAATGMYMLAFMLCDVGAEACKAADLAIQLELQMGQHINPHFDKIIMFYFGAAALVSGVTAYKGGAK